MSVIDAGVIDIHAHAVLESTFGAAGRYGPTLDTDETGTPQFRVGDYVLKGVRYRGSAFMDVDLRLTAMQRAGIDYQVLSPNPLTYFHFIETEQAVAFCRHHNNVLAALIAPHRDRLGAFAALPMQDIDAAIAELTRAVRDLGMLAGYVGTDLPHALDSADMDRFYAACVALDVPLFIHPGPLASMGRRETHVCGASIWMSSPVSRARKQSPSPH
ncbi:MAG: amidohydrolase family protein [Gammaproteobacteria bacterium]|nr:amidohydrolase family protein [Gammaproteobacteria bacterium]